MKDHLSVDYVGILLKAHGVRAGHRVDAEAKAIHWTGAATALIDDGMAHLSAEMQQKEFGVAFLLNLLHRACEHLEGALVAYITASPTSAEALSRVAMELSVSISYILAGDRDARLFAFLRNYIDYEEDRLRKWEKVANGLLQEKKESQLAAVAYRRTGVDAMAEILEQLRVQIPGQGQRGAERWPNIAARFDALGIADAYRTVYARMSSQIHSDAEETIRHFLAVMTEDEELRKRMVSESWAFSRYMLYFAVHFYLEACLAYSVAYRMDRQARILRGGMKIIEKELHGLAKEVD